MQAEKVFPGAFRGPFGHFAFFTWSAEVRVEMKNLIQILLVGANLWRAFERDAENDREGELEQRWAHAHFFVRLEQVGSNFLHGAWKSGVRCCRTESEVSPGKRR